MCAPDAGVMSLWCDVSDDSPWQESSTCMPLVVMTTVCFKCGHFFMPDSDSCGKCGPKQNVMATFKQSSAQDSGLPTQHLGTPGTTRCLDRPMRRRKDRQKLKKKMFKAAEKAKTLQLAEPAGKAAALQLTDKNMQSAVHAAADRTSKIAAPMSPEPEPEPRSNLLLWYQGASMVTEEQSCINAYSCQVPAQSKSELEALPFTMKVRLKNTFLEVDVCNDDDDDLFSYFSLSRSTRRSSLRSISVPSFAGRNH